MIKIIISLIITLLIVYFRTRLINSVFVDKKIKKNISLKIFIVGVLMVGILFIYKYLLYYFGLEKIYFENNIEIKSIGLFITYCTLFISLISGFYKNISKKNIWQSIILGVILFICVGYGGYIFGITSALMYYFIAAYAEEIIKFIAGENIFEREGKYNSDLIFFCILVGLGFAIVENIFYLGSNIFNTQVNLIGLSIGRGLVSSMLHVISTGIIAYITIQGLNKNIKDGIKFLYLNFIGFAAIGIILGFAIHAMYNLSLFYDWKFVSIPLIILGYFLLNFLMFKSDKIYLKNI